MKIICSFFCFFLCVKSVFAVNPNPPTWPANVSVFTTATPIPTIQGVVDGVFMTNGGQMPENNGQFVNDGFAFLFAPGSYTGLDVKIGYYTSIMGLGLTPDDTEINSVSSPQGSDSVTGALDTFWRSAENFRTTPALPWTPTTTIAMTWAVSQAAPLRKVKVNGNLFLFQLVTGTFASGEASGGFMADCTVEGTLANTSAITSGSQQQWFTRNTKMTVPGGTMNPPWSNGVWNQVFVGCVNAPDSHCSNSPGDNIPPFPCTNCSGGGCTVTCTGNPYTTVEATPRIAEKPFISANATATSYSLIIPQLEQNKIGTSEDNSSPTISVDFTNVYVARESMDTAATINAQIAMGYHIILTPGMYNLTDSIIVNRADIVVLGIGFPILISSTGKPCIIVESVNGVRIGGILFQAGPSVNPVTPTLLRWGPEGGDNSITSGFLYDCFARTGRFMNNPSEPFNQTELMVQINSSNITCDNLWLWRGDHDSQGIVFNGDNACQTGFQANGDNIIAYGLASEHHLQDLTEWNGNNGACYFYQAELPYDGTIEYELMGYTGYRVGNNVLTHTGFGIGVYSFFRDHVVVARNGINAPLGTGIQITNALTRYLNGNGGIKSVMNKDLGFNTNLPPEISMEFPGPAYLCDYSDQEMQARRRKFKRAP